MADADLKTLEELNDNMWFEGSPIVICATRLVLDTKTGEMFTSAKFLNVQPDNMKSITFDIICYDEFRKPIDYITNVTFSGLDVERNSDFGFNRKIPVNNIDTRNIEYVIKRVTNIYDQVWENEDNLRFDIKLEQKSIYTILGDYTKQFLDICARSGIDGTNLVMEPVFEEDHWLCACGGFNWSDERVCSQCRVGRSWLEKNTSIEVLEHQKEFQAEEAARVKKEIQEQARMLDDKKSQKAEFEKRKQDYKKQQMKQKSKKATKKVFISIFVTVLIGAAAFGVIFFLIPYLSYSSAISAMNEGNYDEAIEAFKNLNGFMESNEYLKKSTYNKAAGLGRDDKYAEAAELYKSISGYSDADEQYQIMMYKLASASMDAGNYEEAVDFFISAGDYEDSKDKLEECYAGLFREAEYYLNEARKYDIAYKQFKLLNDHGYKNTQEKMDECSYNIANRDYNMTRYGRALEKYAALKDYEPAVEKLEELQVLSQLISASDGDTPSEWESLTGKCSKCGGTNAHYHIELSENGKLVYYIECDDCNDKIDENAFLFKIEKNTTYQMDYDGETKWYKFADIVSLSDSVKQSGCNTELILKNTPWESKNEIAFYGNVSK